MKWCNEVGEALIDASQRADKAHPQARNTHQPLRRSKVVVDGCGLDTWCPAHVGRAPGEGAGGERGVADPLALVLDPDRKSTSGDSIRVIGFCRSREELLTVILVRDPEVSWLWGANGWPSNTTDRRKYMRGIRG